MNHTIKFLNIGRFYNKQDIEKVICSFRLEKISREPGGSITILIEKDCRILADAQIKLLCLCCSITSSGIPLTLDFLGGEHCQCYTYMNRCAFFKQLPKRVSIIPARPQSDTSEQYSGNCLNLLEIRSVDPLVSRNNRPIPSQLTDQLSQLLATNCERFLTEIHTVISEFCNNVSQHSQSNNPGYVYMHHYPSSQRIIIVVADIGIGLLNSLREGLRKRFHPLQDASDSTLILEVLNKGLSRKGEERGSGLNRMAQIAIKYRGNLHIRLESCVVDLKSSGHSFTIVDINPCTPLPGTLISFSFSVPEL